MTKGPLEGHQRSIFLDFVLFDVVVVNARLAASGINVAWAGTCAADLKEKLCALTHPRSGRSAQQALGAEVFVEVGPPEFKTREGRRLQTFSPSPGRVVRSNCERMHRGGGDEAQ